MIAAIAPIVAAIALVAHPDDFPPIGSGDRVPATLIAADYVHRSGRFRASGTGAVVEFTLLPCATVLTRGAEGDLRDVPLGTACEFVALPGPGVPVRVAAILDDFTRVARRGGASTVAAVDRGAGSIVLETRWGGGAADRETLRIDAATRVWKGSGRGTLDDLAGGAGVVANRARAAASGPLRVDDAWVDAEARSAATKAQQATHDAFIRARGVAARVARVEGRRMTVDLFGDPESLKSLLKADGLDAARAAQDRWVAHAVVANEELRTFNPPVDNKMARVVAYEPTPTDAHGRAGVRWVMEPDLLLEGFRAGRVVRLFVTGAWRMADMPYGEGLYTELPGVRPEVEDPEQYPYRTDFGNADLPWYRPRAGEFPPLSSHHLVAGALVAADPAARSGRVRLDGSGEELDFTLLPCGVVRRLGVEAELGDVPIGTRCHLYLYPDDRGAFNRAGVVEDDASRDLDEGCSRRVDEVRAADGVLLAARRHGRVKDEKEELYQPPDLGRSIVEFDGSTRAWKGRSRVALDAIAAGDDLVFNLSGRSATSPGTCVDAWVGPEAREEATRALRASRDADRKAAGVPGWVESAEGRGVVVAFFGDDPTHLRTLLDDGATGDGLTLAIADDARRPTGEPPIRGRIRDRGRPAETRVNYGFSGIRWEIEASEPDDRLRRGRVVRLRREGWPGGK